MSNDIIRQRMTAGGDGDAAHDQGADAESGLHRSIAASPATATSASGTRRISSRPANTSRSTTTCRPSASAKWASSWRRRVGGRGRSRASEV